MKIDKNVVADILKFCGDLEKSNNFDYNTVQHRPKINTSCYVLEDISEQYNNPIHPDDYKASYITKIDYDQNEPTMSESTKDALKFSSCHEAWLVLELTGLGSGMFKISKL